MTEIPSQLFAVFSDVDRAAIATWWNGLPETARAEMARLCDQRLDACFFGVVADERDHVVPKVRGGRFMPNDDAWGFDEWGPSYFDHLVAHPELVLVWDADERKFHTGCTRHPLAQACWSAGEVPADFTCPFASGAECLMKPMAGKRIRRLQSRMFQT